MALTGRASFPTAASEDNQRPVMAAETPATSAAEEEVSAGTGAAVKASGNSFSLPPQHAASPLRSEGGAGVAPTAPSSADAGAAQPAVDTDSAAESMDAPAAGCNAASELPEAAGKPVTAGQTTERGVHARDTPESHPTDAREGLSEADELDLAMKLSLNSTEQGSAAPASAAACSSGNSRQPFAAGQSLEKDLPESSKSLLEHPAAPAGTPAASLPVPAEGRHPADELDHDFVVVEPEEAPGVGFEQVDMPKMDSENAGGYQELISAPAPPPAVCPQQVSEPDSQVPEAPAEACIQHDRADSCGPDNSSKEAALVAEEPTCAAAEHSTAMTGPSKAESRAQPVLALDARAMALLGALPKPGLADDCRAPPSDLDAASVQRQLPSSENVGGAEEAASGEHKKALNDANGQEPSQPGTNAASRAQIARMGSTKEAYLIQCFLDNASSQLTKHGLVSLNEVCCTTALPSLSQSDLVY